MSDENKKEESGVQADNNGVAVGSLNIGGSVDGTIIIGHDNTVTNGYTAEQVAVLIAQIRSTFQVKPFDGRCPYKGLDVFEEEDAELFFGREKLVDDLVSRVKESRTVFVTGPSGSGKSSLVRAGLIHALKQGTIKGSERWLYATMKPGRDPIGELGRVISSLASSTNPEDEIRDKAMKDATIFARWCEIVLKEGRDKRLVLFIDQFEEVFTQISNEEERIAFLNLLTHAATIENGRVIILFSMRSDFVSNCATYPQLNELLSKQFRQIGAMQPEELVSAIAQPALRVGLRIEPDLIAQIINDMKGEPGALPLMSFAIKDLFDSQQEKSGVPALILNDYFQRGGIHKSLERHADGVFATLSADEQELARSVFSGLIETGLGTPDTRRTAPFDELVPADSKADDVQAVVQKLADARLVTTEEDSDKYTITHEKLIDAWPWLKKLINENRDVIALKNEIASDAKEWDEHKRDASYLYSGGRLANVREQLNMGRLDLGGTTYQFIEAGRAMQKRNRVTLISGLSTVIALLVLAVIVFSSQSNANAQLAQQNANIANTAQAASTLAVAQQATAQANAEEAQKQSKISRAGELSAQSVTMREKVFQLSLLLGIESSRLWDTVQTRSVMLDEVNANPQLRQFLKGHTDSVSEVTFSPDGKTLASGSFDGTIILWDVATRLPIGKPLTGHTNSVYSVAFSPDGKTLASGSKDGTIILWDVSTRQPIGAPLTGLSALSIAFSPDGKTLASSGWNGAIILWDVATSQPIGKPLTGHTDLTNVNSVVFSPDGKTLASGSEDGTIILWDVATRQPIGEPIYGLSVLSVAFSPDGKTLASGRDNTIILWDVATRQPIGTPLTGHTNSVYSVTFSPDGKTLASGSRDNTIILWDVATRLPIGQPLTGHNISRTGHKVTIWSVAFSPDGKTLASGNTDMTIILWDVSTALNIGATIRQPIGEPLNGHTNVVSEVTFSPDGKTFASASWDSTIILWDIATRQPIGAPLTGHTSSVFSVAFSPDGKTLASGGWDNTVILWDIATRQSIGEPLTGHTSYVLSVAFSPDGKTLASGSEDGAIILWDVATRQPIGTPLTGHTNSIYRVTFSPDGKTLASGSWDRTIILWDVATRQPIDRPLIGHTKGIFDVAFSPDGKTLASGDDDGIIILWDVATRQPIGAPLIGHIERVSSIIFSLDNKTLASGSTDMTIILWDVATRLPIGQPLTGHTDEVTSVAFSPDSKTLASSSRDNTIILWDVNVMSWIEQSCQRAGGNFTFADWKLYFPNEEYRKTCEQWPLDLEYINAIARDILLNSTDSNRVKTALDKVIAELIKDNNVKDPDAESIKIVSAVAEIQISADINNGNIEEALNLLEQAKQAHININDSTALNNLCWSGSLQGYAKQVFSACEEAVKLAPTDADIRDSRGLARALTGNIEGAVLDFQYFVDNSTDTKSVEQRKQWIIDLNSGKNPFTPEFLKSLQ